MGIKDLEVQKILDILKTKYKPQKVFLFGSAVWGKFREGSDLDFFIIKDSKKPRNLRAVTIFRLLANIDRRYPADFTVLTPKEVKERLLLGDFFIKNILEEGKLLYESK